MHNYHVLMWKWKTGKTNILSQSPYILHLKIISVKSLQACYEPWIDHGIATKGVFVL